MSNKRLISLDVLRGITVAGMILVNDGYGESFSTLRHSTWNGMTPCDLVFPFFLFIMGISTYLSLRKYAFKANKTVIGKIFKRTILIFLIGLAINWFDKAIGGDWLPWQTIRIMGVMQRIALCYCAVSLIALIVNHKYLLHVAFALLIIYTLILLYGNGYAQDASNIAARIDNAVFGYDHLYHKSPVDPEGLLGTISAIAHTLLGFFACKMMMEAKDTKEKVLGFLLRWHIDHRWLSAYLRSSTEQKDMVTQLCVGNMWFMFPLAGDHHVSVGSQTAQTKCADNLLPHLRHQPAVPLCIE